jgi:hypothetical protein
MGGQACVFYGAAQFSRDVDLVLLADEENFARLRSALHQLQAKRIAVPPFDPDLLARGHAVHFRCAAPGVEDLRIDLMTRLRDLPPFPELWEHRMVIANDQGEEFNLLSIPDLVRAKKTQRTKDWPIIELLVDIHYRENSAAPRPAQIQFWLQEARSAELLAELAQRFPAESRDCMWYRPLIAIALSGASDGLREALDAEVRAEQARDRVYWEPLKAELEAFRRSERRSS